jgi:hypothetical protein
MMGSPAYLVVTTVVVHRGIFVDDLVTDFLPFAHLDLSVDSKVLTEINPGNRLESTKALQTSEPLETFFMRGNPQHPNPSQNIFPRSTRPTSLSFSLGSFICSPSHDGC